LSRGNRPPAHERTAEERERDRLERERRRAERSGDASEPLLPAANPAPSVLEPPTDEQLVDHDAAEPPHPEQLVDHYPGEPQHAEPLAESGLDEQQHAEALAQHGLDESPAEVPLPPPLAEPPPRRTIRIGHDRGEIHVSSPGGRPPRASGRTTAPPGEAGPRRRLTRARIAALVALALAIALVWFLVSLFQPFAGSGSGKVIVVIPKGASSSKIGSILAHDGVVSSAFFFDVRATLAGKRGSLHSGRFELRHDMTYAAAIDALSKPPPKAIVVKVVIPEGYTRRQVADLVAEDSLGGSYLQASTRSRLLDPRRYHAPAGTRDLEGFLFPATYELAAGTPAARLVEEQLAAFRERFTSDDVRRARALGVTPYQLLTVASMVEREAKSPTDRPKIAAVIYNRLRKGMLLGIDATIYYAVEQQKGIATYTGELTASQLRIDSPYNTRTHKGLPPTPISNPGAASIEAAAHPAHVRYLYYVAGADGCGEHVFSRTAAEFEKNVAAYDAAVKKNGGKPPVCKKK
jgi:peptidoglycan lytic transglycosylase G